jgi:hypothetical protein
MEETDNAIPGNEEKIFANLGFVTSNFVASNFVATNNENFKILRYNRFVLLI